MKLLDTDALAKKLPIVSSTDLTPESESGLFSNRIFGTTLTERRKKIALIDLNCRIVQPALYAIVKRLNRAIDDIIMLKDTYTLTEEGLLVKDPNGNNGMSWLLSIWDKIKFNLSTPDRKRLYDYIKSLPPRQLFIRYIVVLPPALRPIGKDTTQLSPINELYLKLIKLSNTLKLASQFDSIVAEVQKNALELFNYLSQINKKHGLIRHDIMGKRVDYSARAVVAPASDIPYQYIQVPLKIVVKIFEPFIIHYLLKKIDDQQKFASLLAKHKLSYNIAGIRQLLRWIASGFIKPDDELYKLVKLYSQKAIKDKVVVFKRDPALHRLSLQAAYVIITDEDVVRVPPSRIAALNMDFDGDQCALFVPLDEEAQNEAKQKLLANLHSPTNIGIPWTSIQKDIYTGLYTLTK